MVILPWLVTPEPITRQASVFVMVILPWLEMPEPITRQARSVVMVMLNQERNCNHPSDVVIRLVMHTTLPHFSIL